MDFAVMPRGTKVFSAESCGISAWTKTAKVSVILSDESPKEILPKGKSTFFQLKQALFVNGRLVPGSARLGRVHELWSRVNSIPHRPSMLWYQDWCRKQPDGESIIPANQKYTSSRRLP